MTQSVLFADAEKGLVAYWNFDEGRGDIASDSSGNGHNGMLIRDPWTDGKFRGGLEFGSGPWIFSIRDEVYVPYHEDLNQEDTFTVCAWANAATYGVGYRAVISCRDDFPQRGYILYCTPGNRWQFIIGIGTGWEDIVGPAANLGEWEHVAGTYANGIMKFYVNGKLAGKKTATLVPNTAQEFLIGAGANERTHEYFFKGKIDDVIVYDRELNRNEITEIMRLGGKSFLPVEPSDKLVMTWGKLKLR